LELATFLFCELIGREYEFVFLKEFGTRGNNFFVIKSATIAVDFLQRSFDTKGLSIRSVRAHRLNYICNTDYPCLKKNVIALYSQGITASI